MSSVQVAVRARPLSAREENLGTPFAVEMRGKSTVLHKSAVIGRSSIGRSTAKEFVYDHSYWSANRSDENFVDQELVFGELGIPVLKSAFQGYNACVFAYGQTGSGKTYTMMGSEESPGLIPRICEGLYSWMACEKTQSGEQVSYKTEVSYMEIYNEKVRDLLEFNAGKNAQHNLRVREHPKEGPYVEGLSKHTVSDYGSISELIERGNSHRATASTLMNDTSSRSHAIFTIKFTQAKYLGGLPSETVSKIHLVDLAGSERASATGAEGERLKEGGSINRSLVCLGTVISALADMSSHASRQKKPYIPYRDSVLTWLLKDSLGGNSKTIMIATISPAESSYAETLSTLRYSSRAKNIINKPTVNEDPNVKLIRDLRAEIQRLKSVINTGSFEPRPESKDQGPLTKRSTLAEDIHKKEEQVAELTKEWAQKWTEIQRIVEEHHLALHSEGVKMVVDSKQPHFVGVDPDILSTGLVFYYLKDGSTTIGTRSISQSPDIAVSGNGVTTEHCQVECKGHRVVLHPTNGDCFVNHKRIRKPTRLSQGNLVQLGESTVFRFNNPHEADKLRKRHSEGLLSPRKPLARRTLSDEKIKSGKTSAANSNSVTSCTMTVELKSRSTLSTKAKKRTESSLTLNRTSRCADSQLDVMRGSASTQTSSPRLQSPVQQLSSDLLDPSREIQNPEMSITSRRSWCFSLLIWMTAPLLLSVVSAITFPAVMVLAFLLLCMKMFGFSQQYRLLRWLGTPMAVSTTLVVSPIAGICDIIFRITFSFLTSLGFVQEQSQIQRPPSALSIAQK